MERKGLRLSYIIIGILIVIILVCGINLYSKNKRIVSLEKAQIQNTSYSLDVLGKEILGQNFDSLNVNVKSDGKNEKLNLKYKIAGKDQKEVVLNNIELIKENNKWIVLKNSKLTKMQLDLVEKIANNRNEFMEQMQNNICKQVENMDKQINTLKDY